MDEKKINSVAVDPVVVSNKDEQKRKGFDIFPIKNWITYICARKGSGKTSLINSIIEKTTDKHTVIWLFVSTYRVDPTWKKIIETLEDKGYTVNCFDAIYEGKGRSMVNNLETIVKGLNAGEEQTSSTTLNTSGRPVKTPAAILDRFGLPCKFIDLFGGSGNAPVAHTDIGRDAGVLSSSTAPKKKKKRKSNTPANLFIFDDIANQLQNPAVTALLKIHRHSDSNVIVSSQSLNDLALSALYQINFFIAFKGLSEAKLEECWRKLDISVPYDTFLEAYRHATQVKYDFFYLNTRSDEMRRCFNYLLTYNKDDDNSNGTPNNQ